MKKIVSFTLKESTIQRIDRNSKALGVNRSQLLDFLICKYLGSIDDVVLERIISLQQQLRELIRGE